VTTGRFDNHVVVVTGATSGIGREIAHQFAAESARVVVVDIDAAGAEAVAAEIAAAGGSAVPAEADVSDEQAVEALFARVLSELGSVDVLVNNAAIAHGDGLLELDAAAWDRELAVDLRSAFGCTRAALRTMVERRRGAIVNITA
jgi:3-oxoacyl-[acyl-carrier protein] reductase